MRARLGLCGTLVVGLGLGLGLVAATGCPGAEGLRLPDGPPRVVHTNDGNMDVYTLEYLMALASAGRIDLVGIVADAGASWGSEPAGGPRVWEIGREQYQEVVRKARHSGMTGIPDAVAGANRALAPPASGVIEDTRPLDTPGARLLRDRAREADPSHPLLVVAGGPLTSVADAYLLDPSIAERMLVLALMGQRDHMGDYNSQVDGWAAYIVAARLRYVQFPVGLGTPVVTKQRLGRELPDNELTRFMIDKRVDDEMPGDYDGDGTPAVVLARPDLVLRVRGAVLDGWFPVRTWGNGYPFVPRLRPEAGGRATVVLDADGELATGEWWRAMTDPRAYRAAIVEQSAYSGAPWPVPGRIEAERFDWGGEGHAYHDTDNNGWVDWRTTDRVDLEPCTDSGGGLAVRAIEAGEWLEYTVAGAVPGFYLLVARIRSALELPAALRVAVDGVPALDPVAIPRAEAWTSLELGAVALGRDEQVLRLEFDAGGFHLNWIELLPAARLAARGEPS